MLAWEWYSISNMKRVVFSIPLWHPLILIPSLSMPMDLLHIKCPISSEGTKNVPRKKNLYTAWLAFTVLLVCVLFYHECNCICACIVFSYCTVQWLVTVMILYISLYGLVFLWLFFVIFVLFLSFLSCSIWCFFATLFWSFLSCFGTFCLVAHGCNMVAHTTTYYQVLHENPRGTRTVPGLQPGVQIISP